MQKFAIKGNDKIVLVDGVVPRALGVWIRKRYWRDGAADGAQDGYWWGAPFNEGGNYEGNALETAKAWTGESKFITAFGSWLNSKSICHLGKYLYTVHVTNETVASANLNFHAVSRNPKIMQWDGIEDNVNETAWPSGRGARVMFGYSSRASERFDINGGFPGDTADVALVSYKGHVVGIGASLYGEYPHGSLSPSGDEAARLDVYATSIDAPLYYSFWLDPNQNGGSGLTTFTMYASGNDASPNKTISHFETPSWMLDNDEYLALKDYVMFDSPYYNYSMTDAIEFQDWIYACNSCHLVRCGSGFPNFELLYDTGQSPYTVSPKWLEKHEGNLFMLEGSGVVSQIVPSGDGIVKNNLSDLSYVDPGNIRYGGIHAREWGVERATKNLLVSYQDQLHAFVGMGSGAYHFVGSGDMSSWNDRTADLPALFRTTQCNIHGYRDPHDGKLYVLASPMVSDNGIYGIVTFGNKVTGTSHLYSYNGTTWEKHGWFPIQSMWHAGGFVGFDAHGPHVAMPSGTDYPYGRAAGSGLTSITPAVFKCKDYAVLDYQLLDEWSRNIDVSVQFSLDDGCTWATCSRFKDYSTLQYLGEGTEALSASPSGEWHSFYWNFVQAVGYNVNYPYTKLRVIPSISNTQ
jgi:hypothetical protein